MTDAQLQQFLGQVGAEEVPYDPTNPLFSDWDRTMGLPPSTKKFVAKLIEEGAWDDLATILDLEEQQEPPGERWTCTNRWCKSTGDWWISIHGVIHCSRCCPPSLPGLVALEGTAQNAPYLDLVSGKPLLDAEFRG